MERSQIEIQSENLGKKICKVYGDSETKHTEHTGFFCKIPLNEKEYIRVLITSGFAINEEDLRKESIKIYLKNCGVKKIVLDNRIKFSNKEVTIIEIKLGDDIGDESFFEIDPGIFTGYTKFKKQALYFLYFTGYSDEINFSQGLFLDLSDIENEFFHTCMSGSGSSGGPLINSSNNRVIGMHSGTLIKSKSEIKKRIGTCLNELIEEFKKKFFSNYKNNKDSLTPQRIKSLDDYRKKYKIKEKILYNKFYTIFSVYSINDGKLAIVKEFNDNICERFYNYIDEEISALNKIRNKFILKLKEYYLSKDKSILIFEFLMIY